MVAASMITPQKSDGSGISWPSYADALKAMLPLVLAVAGAITYAIRVEIRPLVRDIEVLADDVTEAATECRDVEAAIRRHVEAPGHAVTLERLKSIQDAVDRNAGKIETIVQQTK